LLIVDYGANTLNKVHFIKETNYLLV
jgi:hypothetical protein